MHTRCLIGLALLGLVGGCQAPAPAPETTAADITISDYDAYVDGALSTLRQCHLPPQYADRTRGEIITERTTGQQWFEFWRVDARGPYNLLESSLHTLGRQATVRIEPLDGVEITDEPALLGQAPFDNASAAALEPAVAPPARFRVSVVVEKSRLTTPPRQVTTASGALALYSERVPTTTGLVGARAVRPEWVPLGRDGLLEAYLLERLTGAVPGIDPTPISDPSGQ